LSTLFFLHRGYGFFPAILRRKIKKKLEVRNEEEDGREIGF
jgi:hypothetical protein